MKTAVLGFGTVGVGVYEMLAKARGLEPGPVARLVTKPMSISAMHETARRLRARGAALFFAAIGS